MRPGNSGRRPRGRPNRKQHHHGGGQRGHNFDSSGPEGRIRGNAHQIYEKYLALARDATSAGDRISAEAYFQHAEHYFRIINDSTDPRSNGQDGPSRNRVNGPDGQRDGGYRGHGAEGHERYANGPDEQLEAQQPQERAQQEQQPREQMPGQQAGGHGGRGPQNQRGRRRQRDDDAGLQSDRDGNDKEPANA